MPVEKFQDIDEYIVGFSSEIQAVLEELRAVIKEAAPEAQETINYQIPTFKQNGNLVHFAAYKTHIGFYPAPSGIEVFREELLPYKVSKGTISFPYGKSIPYDLIRKIVKFRLAENLAKAAAK